MTLEEKKQGQVVDAGGGSPSVGGGVVGALTVGDRAGTIFVRWFTLVAFVAMVATFAILKSNVFLTWDNIKSILDFSAPVLILALGLTIVLVVGEFDLSFQGLVALVAVICAKMLTGGTGLGIVLVIAVAAGVAGGMVAGALVATKRASSFILTLALGSLWGGVALGLSDSGQTILVEGESFAEIAGRELFGIPITIFYAVAVALLVAVILRFTVFGRKVTAVGNNPEAARLSGLRVSWIKIGAFALLGLCSAIAAILLTSRTSQYSSTISAGVLIPPYVAAFFGTSVLNAKRFNVFGTLVGATFIATMQTGLIILGIQEWVSSVIVGGSLIVILMVAATRSDAGAR